MNKKNLFRKFRRLLLSTMSGGLLLAIIILVILIASSPTPPQFEEMKFQHRPSDALLLDRNGETIHRLRVNFDVRQGEWIALEDISPALTKALIIAEDKRFQTHFGVDIKAGLAGAWSTIFGSHPRGASTITMQLVGLLDNRIAPSGKRTVWQKMQQATAAIVLERNWSKDEILEAYLNIVPFKGELVGVGAMAESLLDKHPNGIDEREAAMAVAMIRSPNASQAVITRRACIVLQQAEAMNHADECAELADFIQVRFAQPRTSPSQGIAPHLAYRLLRNAMSFPAGDPLVVQSTLDAGVQRTALESLRQHLIDNQQHNIEDGGVIVIDNITGEIIAWVGSSGDDISQAAQVDAVTALRQPGSTLKPFLFGQAIQEKRLTAASLLEDTPLDLDIGGALYAPKNYDRAYKGWVSVRTALASSLNIPTVRAVVMVTPSRFATVLNDLGLPLKEGGDYYGFSLALGSAEVTLVSLTNAYRALYNGGKVEGVRWIAESNEKKTPTVPSFALPLPNHQSAIGPQAAWIIGHIISDRHARVSTFGLDSELNTRYWSAVKTGTSKDMRDNWAVGYSNRYTIGVWVGNASGAPMWGVSGTSGASPVWRDVMNYLYEQDLAKGLADQWAAPSPPEGVVQTRITYSPVLEASRLEWFIEGTEQSEIVLTSSLIDSKSGENLKAVRIVSPTSGLIMALDPDIPPENQLLTLSALGDDLRWKLGGRIIGSGAVIQWQPIPGRHMIILTDVAGNELDHIRVEVRGASVISTPTTSDAATPSPALVNVEVDATEIKTEIETEPVNALITELEQ